MKNAGPESEKLKESASEFPPKADRLASLTLWPATPTRQRGERSGPKAGKTKLIVILGPTASGKTRLAVRLAKLFNGEIVSADSRQVYKGLDIGTGKDLKEYDRVPYHLIDIVSPQHQFNLADWQKLAYQAIDKIIAKDKIPLLVGGSGLYLQAITDGYQLSRFSPNQKLRKFLSEKNKTELQKLTLKLGIKLNPSDFQNKRRLIRAIEIKQSPQIFKPEKNPRYDCLLLGLKFPKKIIDNKIDQRLAQRLSQGLINEVKKIKKSGLSWQRLNGFGLEYRYVAQYLRQELNYDQMVKKLGIEIHRFAKRQMTWFKRMPDIRWIESQKQAVKLIKEFLR